MSQSRYFETVKKNFLRGFWSIDKVRDAVEKKWITAAEFKEITRKDYKVNHND